MKKSNVYRCKVCYDTGNLEIAYDDLNPESLDGEYGIYVFLCRCTWPGGNTLEQLSGVNHERYFDRKPDYVGRWKKKVRMHPKNIGKYFAVLRKKIRARLAQGEAKGNVLADI